VAGPALREDAGPTERTGPAVVHPLLDAVAVEGVFAFVELIKLLTYLRKIPNADSTFFSFKLIVKRNWGYDCLELPHQLPLVVADDQIADG
jgi:hypothetical protein